MTTALQYIEELQSQTRYTPTWLPTVRVTPGDIGRLDGYQFTKVATLADFSITFEVEDMGIQSDLWYASRRAVSTNYKAAGKVPPVGSPFTEAEAGITVNFSRENAVVFHAFGCRSARIKNQLALGKTILGLHERGKWDKDLAVVTEALTADSVTILIASSSDAQIDFLAAGDIKGANVQLADLDLKLQTRSEKSLSTKIIGATQLTPLFRASGVKRRVLRPNVFRSEQDADSPDVAFAELDYADFVAPSK